MTTAVTSKDISSNAALIFAKNTQSRAVKSFFFGCKISEATDGVIFSLFLIKISTLWIKSALMSALWCQAEGLSVEFSMFRLQIFKINKDLCFILKK